MTGDENIYNLTLKFLYHVLDHQDETGWLGPEGGVKSLLVPRTLIIGSRHQLEQANLATSGAVTPSVSASALFAVQPHQSALHTAVFGAIQLVEHDPALIPRVIPALHRFVVLANKMLHKHKTNGEDDPNETGVDDWAATRWEDFVVALQWLHDWYPEGQEALLVDTMTMLKVRRYG